MKTILVNKGRARQGKSESIIKTAQLLQQKYPNAKIEPANIDYTQDIKLIMTIDDIKIGIESKGDPNSRLPKSLDDFSKKDCDIILCSSRTSGSTVKAIEELKKTGYEVIWTSNARSKEALHEILNKLTANYFFTIIDHLIKSSKQ